MAAAGRPCRHSLYHQQHDLKKRDFMDIRKYWNSVNKELTDSPWAVVSSSLAHIKLGDKSHQGIKKCGMDYSWKI